MKPDKTWDWEITSRSSWWNINLKEWWDYRHLLARLVRRDFLLKYQQTILGPAWILLQPLATLTIYIFVFSNIIGIGTGNIPPALFYLSGIVLWNFFSETFLDTAFTFTHNAELFSKVYFPRLIIPLAGVTSKLVRFSWQFLLLLLFMFYYWIIKDVPLKLNGWLLMMPLLMLVVTLTGFSTGLIFSLLTGKYRDLVNIINLGIRLLMFITPVIYPLSVIPPDMQWIANLNPLSPLFEAFRFMLFNEGAFSMSQLLYSFLFMGICLVSSLSLFSKQGDKLIDIL